MITRSGATPGILPVSIFPVSPGDKVSAGLRIENGRWAVSINDVTERRSATVYTPDQARAVYDRADWMHELVMPVDGDALRYSYPTSTVRISRLTVNSLSPRFDDALSTWIAAKGGYIAPSPLRGASFMLGSATITPIGRRYLEIAHRENVAAKRFSFQMKGWTDGTPRSPIASARRALSRVLAEGITSFTNPPWPQAIQTLIDALVSRTRALITQTDTAPGRSPNGLGAWKAAWHRDAHAADLAALAIRRELGIPQMRPP